MKKYLDTFFSMFSKEKDKKTKTQNLVFLAILLVFALICINTIPNRRTKQTVSKVDNNKEISNKIESSHYNNIEDNLKNILSQISGVSDVAVMITYSSEEKIIPVYDVKEEVTVEENSDGDETNTSKKTTTEKTVAYEEIDGGKVAIVESKISPEIIGAIITAKGLDSTNTLKIKSAVSNTLNIPVHKVEIFSK
jgi:stage III sporulation protein AG